MSFSKTVQTVNEFIENAFHPMINAVLLYKVAEIPILINVYAKLSEQGNPQALFHTAVCFGMVALSDELLLTGGEISEWYEERQERIQDKKIRMDRKPQ